MTSYRLSPKALSSVASGVMAVAVLAGCTGSAHLARAGTYSERDATRASRNADKDVVRAERALARSPQNATLRSSLGIAYLQTGRFASATQVLDDAMRLGDNSPRTALSLALAKIGAGRGREAVAILDDWRDGIPPSDLGLALALAGESSRGVAILTDALRGGDNTTKLRQNLAYAYALDGRWREARTMMEQDVPADLIERRISEWAMQGKPEDFQKRVAGLLGAPVRNDPGLPQSLALADTAPIEQLAAETSAAQPSRPPSRFRRLPNCLQRTKPRRAFRQLRWLNQPLRSPRHSHPSRSRPRLPKAKTPQASPALSPKRLHPQQQAKQMAGPQPLRMPPPPWQPGPHRSLLRASPVCRAPCESPCLPPSPTCCAMALIWSSSDHSRARRVHAAAGVS